MSDIEELQQKIRSFAEGRVWAACDAPKNLLMGLTAEAGALLAEFNGSHPSSQHSMSSPPSKECHRDGGR